MAGAFQATAFSASAFQVGVLAPVSSGGRLIPVDVGPRRIRVRSTPSGLRYGEVRVRLVTRLVVESFRSESVAGRVAFVALLPERYSAAIEELEALVALSDPTSVAGVRSLVRSLGRKNADRVDAELLELGLRALLDEPGMPVAEMRAFVNFGARVLEMTPEHFAGRASTLRAAEDGSVLAAFLARL